VIETIPNLPAAVRKQLPDATLVTVIVRGARHLSAIELERQTAAAYRDVRTQLNAGSKPHVIRMWNFIPALLEPTSAGQDRYMAFNAGRFSAMCDWFGGAGHLEKLAPAGSGVGTASDDLTIHALAMIEPGIAIQNPRQKPAVHYSPRYGPKPPCFARATKVGNVLLVSGTAAITGEESVGGDLDRQLDVTLDNLRALVGELSSFTSVRAYFPRASDFDRISRACSSTFLQAGAIEFVNVDLCRCELLVEIEGVAVQSTQQ